MYSLSIVCTEPINNYVFIYFPISVGKPVGMSALISASTVAVTVAVLCIYSVYAEHSIQYTVLITDIYEQVQGDVFQVVQVVRQLH